MISTVYCVILRRWFATGWFGRFGVIAVATTITVGRLGGLGIAVAVAITVGCLGGLGITVAITVAIAVCAGFKAVTATIIIDVAYLDRIYFFNLAK